LQGSPKPPTASYGFQDCNNEIALTWNLTANIA